MNVYPVLVFIVGLVPAADAPKGSGSEKPPLRYVTPAGDDYRTEAEVTITKSDKGTVFLSKTFRDKETMVLQLNLSPEGKIVSATTTQEKGNAKKTITAIPLGESVQLKQGGTSLFANVKGSPVITTAPDWSDIIQLVQRYDKKEGGKQEFPGLWIHPTETYIVLKFTIEHIDDKDKITVEKKEITLNRYVIKLRSGDYLVWADAGKKVIKLMKNDPKAAGIYLEGYQEAAKELGPK